MARPPILAHRFRALRYRDFRLFFAGQGVSLIGTWLQQVAMGWLTYRLTGSAFVLGLVAFCANIGYLVLGPVAGVVADRVHRRKALVLTQSLLLAQALALAATSALVEMTTWQLVAFALWLGTVSAFDVPIRQSLYVQLVASRDDLPNAIALNSLMVNTARVVGPALAGILLALVGESTCFALNALSFVAVIAAMRRIHWPHAAQEPHASGWWANWIEGVRYAVSFEPLRIMLAVVAVMSWTITPYSSLMPIYAKTLYAGGPEVLGALLSSAGAGALAGTLYLAGRTSIVGLGRVIAIASTTCGLALLAFSHLRWLPLAMVLIAMVGAGVILTAASTNTILHTLVEDRLRGRVSAFYTMAFLGGAPLGNLAAGAFARAIGAPAALALNGVVCAAVGVWFWRRLPALRAAMRPVYAQRGVIPDEH